MILGWRFLSLDGSWAALMEVGQFLQAEASRKALVVSNDGRKDPARTAGLPGGSELSGNTREAPVAVIPTLLSQAGCVHTCVCVHMSVYTPSEHARTFMHGGICT